MQGSEAFTATIQNYLQSLANTDQLFAETFKKPAKNIKECINYIFSEVKKTGNNGFADEEIYGMAVHYYDEDNIKIDAAPSGNVVVNHSLPPTPKQVVKNPTKKLEPVKPVVAVAPVLPAKKVKSKKVISPIQATLF